MARDTQTLARGTSLPIAGQDRRPVTDGSAGTTAIALDAAWPVGAIFISAVATSPALLMGFGNWELFAQGRVLVGIDPTQTEFDTLGEAGGEKTHALTCDEVPDC